ncbi:hypothetical protein BOX15_Mlig002721g4 [Macrostomum lignano]|uniref:Biogenesis of lysosome-related organelles complex 1 subunit 3 n=1 Tax=Macrostomum lignano TaxID=282301 RepID=A0A267E3A1_9PLAT|nr:hypothetical protein BOX15_Mlig002721g4 [Macrostomum lignano]
MSQPSSAVIVEGEAPESDDEEQQLTDSPSSDVSSKKSTAPTVAKDAIATEHGAQSRLQQQQQQKTSQQEQQRRYASSALHARFFQDAGKLQSALVARRASTYEAATKELRGVASQLAKTHACIQDASHALRLTTNDLYKLDDRLQALTKTDWLAGL